MANMNGGDRLDEDEDTDGEDVSRYAPLLKDGSIKHSVPYFSKFGKRVGTDHTKKIKRSGPDVTFSPLKTIDKMKYKIKVGVVMDDQEERFLSLHVHASPAEKMEEWFCFVDAELRLLHPKTQDHIAFSGTVVMTNTVADVELYGWENFATWDQVEEYMDKKNKDTITVEVIIRNQMMFSVCESIQSHREPVPTRKQMDDFVRPLFNSSKLADVFFQLEGGAEIPAHRLVLASKSGVFQKLLYETKPFDRVIDLKREGFGDIQKAALLSLFKFYYRAELIINDRILADVYYAAKKFKVDVVQETCKVFVKEGNEIPILARAMQLKLKKLAARCWDVIRKDPIAFIKSPQFLTCDPDELKILLVSDNLSVPEFIIFKSCKNWAISRSKAEGNDDPQPRDLRAILGPRLYLIRFPLIKAEKLAAILEEDINQRKADSKVGLFNMWEVQQLKSYMEDGKKDENFLFSTQKRKPAD